MHLALAREIEDVGPFGKAPENGQNGKGDEEREEKGGGKSHVLTGFVVNHARSGLEQGRPVQGLTVFGIRFMGGYRGRYFSNTGFMTCTKPASLFSAAPTPSLS